MEVRVLLLLEVVTIIVVFGGHDDEEASGEAGAHSLPPKTRTLSRSKGGAEDNGDGGGGCDLLDPSLSSSTAGKQVGKRELACRGSWRGRCRGRRAA
uniref:Secreted protein n=1 Tax=Oryza nivara TaxID=4536 RepID=A0A0E0IBN7_ORYNI